MCHDYSPGPDSAYLLQHVAKKSYWHNSEGVNENNDLKDTSVQALEVKIKRVRGNPFRRT